MIYVSTSLQPTINERTTIGNVLYHYATLGPLTNKCKAKKQAIAVTLTRS